MDKIKVKISLLGDMEKYSPNEGHDPVISVNYGLTLTNILQLLNIPKEKETVILVNGRRADKDNILEDNDEITLFPPVDGG